MLTPKQRRLIGTDIDHRSLKTALSGLFETFDRKCSKPESDIKGSCKIVLAAKKVIRDIY